MARNRTPQGKATVSGADLVHPGRFADRKAPPKAKAIGEPYLKMTDDQKAVWFEVVGYAPWLRAHHRIALRQACVLTARMDEGDMGISGHQCLSALLSKLGLTPVDDTKVNHGDGNTEEPGDEFFGRPN